MTAHLFGLLTVRNGVACCLMIASAALLDLRSAQQQAEARVSMTSTFSATGSSSAPADCWRRRLARTATWNWPGERCWS